MKAIIICMKNVTRITLIFFMVFVISSFQTSSITMLSLKLTFDQLVLLVFYELTCQYIHELLFLFMYEESFLGTDDVFF
jgi:hypothetical protein